MNTIDICKKVFLLGAIIIVLPFSCLEKKSDCIVASKEFIKKWQSDSTGCLGFRHLFIERHRVTLESFVKRNVGCLQSNLGNADIIKGSKDYKLYYYFTSCKYLFNNPHNGLSKKKNPEGTSMLVFKVDKKNMVINVYETTP